MISIVCQFCSCHVAIMYVEFILTLIFLSFVLPIKNPGFNLHIGPCCVFEQDIKYPDYWLIPRKLLHHDMTEKLLTGILYLNKTNKQKL